MTSLSGRPSTVIYTFTDDPSNTDTTCTFTVTVNPDPNAPTITDCPADIDMMTAVARKVVAVTWVEPTAQDSSLKDVPPVITYSPDGNLSPGADFPLGPTTVTYTFTDGTGLQNSCSFTVTVSQPPSTSVTATATDCPILPTGTTAVAGQSAVITWTPQPTAKDSNDNPVAIATQTHSPGDSFPLGKTVVTYTFTDDNTPPNIARCSFTVTVSQPASTSVIISGCPDDITQTSANLAAMWTEPTAQDSNNNPVQLFSRSHASGSSFSAGSTTPVTYTFTDASTPANTASCNFTVTITQ